MSVSMCQCALACYHMQHAKRPGSGGPYLSADLHLLHVPVLSPHVGEIPDAVRRNGRG